MKLFSKIATVLAGFSLALGVGVAAMTSLEKNPTRAEAADGQNHDMGISEVSQLLNNGNVPGDIDFADQGYTVKQVIIGWTHNKTNDGITATVKVGGTTLGSGKVGGQEATTTTTIGDGNTSLSGAVNISFTSTLSGTGKGTLKIQSIILVEGQAGAELETVTVSGTMTTTNYTTAASWNPAGLTVTGSYDDSSNRDLTAAATFAYYNASDVEVPTPSDLGVGENQTLKVVATVAGVSSAKYVASSAIKVTKAIQYKLVTDATKLTKNTTAIIVGTGTYSSATYTKAMIATHKTSNGSFGNNAEVTLSNSFNAGSVATSANATVFTLGGSAGAWTLSNGTDKLGFTGTSNNNIQFNESLTDTFTISSVSGQTYVTINSNTHSGRGLRMNVNSGSPLFSNYGSGNQQPVYLFADIAEATFGTIDHISIATEPQTSFHSGSTYSASGMVVVAWDGADETTANSKVLNASDYSLKIDGAAITSDVTVFDDSDIGPHTITVTHTENAHDYTDTYSLYVYATATYEKVTTEPANWAGDYLIVADIPAAGSKVEAGTYAMRSTGINLDYVGNYAAVSPATAGGKTTITTGQEFQFQIAAVTGGYSIKGQGNKYIGWGSASSNGMNSSDTALVNTISFEDSVASIICSEGTKGLKLDKDSGQFRYYSNPGVHLYKLAESTEAADYAADFLEMLSTGAGHVCQADGNSDLEDLKVAWAILADDFQSLSSNAVRQQFTQGTADESGDDIAKALALYDFIATKYGTRLESDDCDNYNFMGRTITPISSIHNIFGQNTNGNNILLIVVISSITVASAIGLFFIIRRRKHN